MGTVYLKSNDPTVKEIIRATFPNFTGREVQVHITDHVQFTSTMWDEGYKRTYKKLRLADMAVDPVEQEQFMRRSEFHENTFTIPPGFVVVVYVNCRGGPNLEIISPPENVTKILPPPLELSDDEKTVLIATRSLKSSYAGVKDFRFHQAKEKRGITRERWDVAKASLIARKLLNAAGAVTTDGRNAIGFEQL